MDSATVWSRLKGALAPLVPTIPESLGPPATDAGLNTLSTRTGRQLRDTLSALYDTHDGQSDDAPGLFVGLRFLPAAEAAEEWSRWSDMIQQDPSLVTDIAVTSQPDGAVRPVYFSDGWIPIATDGTGNGVAVDLDPGPAGTAGQLICFGADEPTRTVLADSPLAFLDWLTGAIESGTVTAASEPDAPGGTVLAIGPATHLLDALPTVLGSS